MRKKTPKRRRRQRNRAKGQSTRNLYCGHVVPCEQGDAAPGEPR